MREVVNQQQGLYRPEFEHDNCGIGAVVNIKGKKTHDTVANALKIVENLEHRAGKDAEGKTGDGVGILLQISHKFFKKVCKKEGFDIGGEREYGVAQLFFPQQEIKRAQAKKMFEIIVEKEGLELLGWRTVPVFPEVLGHKAKECMPCIMQAFVKKPEDVEKGLAFDRMLYIARREFEQSNDNTYVVSMNSRTIVYKGMFLVGQLRTFFGDLQSQDYESAIAVVHSRFSTNTNPSWERAHPNRFIVHNGEINTIRGNADKMLAREENMESPYLKDELHKVLPVVNRNGSDSAMLDNTLEFLVMSGMDLPLAVMITIPEPWANNDTISTVVKGKEVKVAKNADDEGVLGGLDNFKVQIIQCADDEGMYVIRSVKEKDRYLYGLNDKLAWGTDKNSAMKFTITAGDPTSNESVADGAAGVKVIGGNGIVEIQGAAGKKVVISNILGKVVAETILASDNATIAVPAGIIAVAVEGENAVKTIVK